VCTADSVDSDTSRQVEDRLRIIMGCENWKIVGKEGDRSELKYRVENVSERVSSRDDLNRKVERMLRSKMDDFEDEDRAIIYCLQRDSRKELTGFLNKEFGERYAGHIIQR
jgi:superfamily II DNA helicase RecQ